MRSICIATLVITTLLGGARAGAETWSAIGPPGGTVRTLASDPRDPDRIYLGTAQGILYRSDDGGQRWHRLTPGFPRRGCALDAIVVGPRGVVWIGFWEVDARRGGVARSNDGGRTFTMLRGIDQESVRALALASSDPRVMAAGTVSGVFLSRDAGRTWGRITENGDSNLHHIESVAFDPNDAQVLYAGTWHLAWKTTDGGASWAPIHRGMLDDSDVMTLTVERRDPQNVYATACTGIYRSTDGAAAWKKLGGIPDSSRRTRSFALGNDDPNLLVAGTTEGLWISEDGAASWRLATRRELTVNAVLLQPDGTIVVGAEDAGVLRSTDDGHTWSASNEGFGERFVSRAVFGGSGYHLLVAARGDPRYSGVFYSPGLRGPWTRLTEGLERREILSLALQDDVVLAGTDDGIFTRELGGTSWRRLPLMVDGAELHARVLEVLARPPNALLIATSKGLIRSVDRGWTRAGLGNGEVSILAASPDDGDRLFAATPDGCFLSQDGGVTWNQVSPGWKGIKPHAFAFMPSHPRTIFATSTGGLLRSEDEGATWWRVSGGVPHSDLTGLAIDSDGTIFVSDFTSGGIFRSTNGGASWQRMPTDGLGSERVWTLSIDPASHALIAASAAGGLHVLAPQPPASASAARSVKTEAHGGRESDAAASSP
jgi:photosystem II stability/assembly factor-like uncharacterized protein